MLQNSPVLCHSQAIPAHPNSSAQLLILQTLCKQIEAHKLSLTHALTINHLLVQEASIFASNSSTLADSWSNEQGAAFTQVKLEDCQESQSDSVEIRVRKQGKKSKTEEGLEQGHDKNQTKNIPKNYGKAILSFIQKNIQKYLTIIKPILVRGKLSINDLLLHIKKHKKEVNSINYLKEMWGYQDPHNPILKCIRVLSYVFMRKHCLAYIFNSRVKNYSTHIKYRTRIIEGIQHPEEFTCIKQF